jgi:hypothetical protein
MFNRVLLTALLGGGLLAAAGSGCLYDENDRCSDGQVHSAELKGCVCPAGSVLAAGVCKACGANEEAVGTECKCTTGHVRSPAGACELVASGPGSACSPAANSCTGAASHCQAAADGGGYCTSKGCSGHGDCTGGWTCTTWEAAPYCRRPPTGVGKTCASSADCAGLDASYCEVLQAKTCMVAGCTVSPDTCGVGLACCDLAPVGLPVTLCLPPGSCPT